MKKILSIALVLLLVLSLAGCGSNPYEKYEYINKMLDEGDYEGAVQAIYELYRQSQATAGTGGDPNGDPTDVPNIPTTTEKPQPNDDELTLLNEYRNIVRSLTDYETGTSTSFYYYNGETSYNGSAALAYVYGRLQELSSIDHWLEAGILEDRWNDTTTNPDRQAVLNKFTLVEDVLLDIQQETLDNMGNTSKQHILYNRYNTDGQLIYTKNMHLITFAGMNSYYTPEYDASGRIIKCTFGSSGNISAILTYTYDNAGKITKLVRKTNSGEIEYVYTYNAGGQVETIVWDYNFPSELHYEYDAQGRVSKETFTQLHDSDRPYNIYHQSCVEYTYNAAGVLTNIVYSIPYYGYNYSDETAIMTSNMQDQYTLVCDAQGRVTQATVIPGDRISVREDAGAVLDSPNYQKATYTVNYGTYYLYAGK